MSVPLLRDEVGDPAPGASPHAEVSPRRFAVAWRRLLPRAYDVLVLLWVTLFHHVLGVKFRFAQIAGVAGVAATWLAYMLITDSLSWYVLQLKRNFAYTENYAYQLRWASRNPEGYIKLSERCYLRPD